jgi:hypothetical protein
MRDWFRTKSWSSRHPDAKPGLLQIYQYRYKTKNVLIKWPFDISLSAGCKGVPDERGRR